MKLNGDKRIQFMLQKITKVTIFAIIFSFFALMIPQSVNAQTAECQGNPNDPVIVENCIREIFGQSADTAIKVAKCESSLRVNAVGDKRLGYYRRGVLYGRSYGVFQIRYLPGRPSPSYLTNLENNVRYAYKMSGGTNFRAWSCYKTGKYLKFSAD